MTDTRECIQCEAEFTGDTMKPISLTWLGDRMPGGPYGVTWGVPWAKGDLTRSESLAIYASDGTAHPLQTWNLAYWPNGSVKWTAHTMVADAQAVASFELRKGQTVKPEIRVICHETEKQIEIDTGVMSCRLARSGPSGATSWISR